MKQAYTIAFCDILGFKRTIQQVPIDTVVGNLLSLFRKALFHSVHKGNWPTQPPSMQQLNSHNMLGIAWFSDAVMIYTRADSDENVRELIRAVGWLLFESMFSDWTRLRAAIAYGEAYIDPKESIYLGGPIVEAYGLESKQIWSGCALTESAEARLKQFVQPEEISSFPLSAQQRRIFQPELWLARYPVPLKTGKSEMVAVDWTLGGHPQFKLRFSQQSAVPTPSDWKQAPDVCEKWKNTVQFHCDMCRHCS